MLRQDWRWNLTLDRGRATMRILLSLFMLAAVMVMPAGAKDDVLRLAHDYAVSGKNPDGGTYRGTVQIDVISDTTFKIVWRVGSTTYRGFGMRVEDLLAASYEGGGIKGVILYAYDHDSKELNGRWTLAGQDGTGSETLTPK
jgi:hypothetical protein